MKTSGTEVISISIWLLQRQDLLARRQELNATKYQCRVRSCKPYQCHPNTNADSGHGNLRRASLDLSSRVAKKARTPLHYEGLDNFATN